MARNKLPFDYRAQAGVFLSSFVEGTISLSTQEDVVIDATLSGKILTSGFCEITENGSFDGDITSRSVTVYGSCSGDVAAKNTIEIKRSAKIKGLYSSPVIHIEPGAVVNARIVHTQDPTAGPL